MHETLLFQENSEMLIKFYLLLRGLFELDKLCIHRCCFTIINKHLMNDHHWISRGVTFLMAASITSPSVHVRRVCQSAKKVLESDKML